MVGCDWGLNVNFKSRFHNTYWDAPFKISGSFEEKRLSAFEVKLIYSQSGKTISRFRLPAENMIWGLRHGPVNS